MAPMGESVDDSRTAEHGQADGWDENGLAEPDEADQPVNEPEPPLDEYVPV